MGNQTLVPSQIQSVESYLLDLKSYIEFNASLGSTTFMKTARVNLVESPDDYLLDSGGAGSHGHHAPLVIDVNDSSGAPIAASSSSSGVVGVGDPSSSSSSSSAAAAAAGASSPRDSSSVSAQAAAAGAANAGQAGGGVDPLYDLPLRQLNQQQLLRHYAHRLRNAQQQIVVKIFPKYDMSIRLDLYYERVKEIKAIVYSRYGLSTNCLPFAEVYITERAAFLFRQYVKHNLYDRLSTRPFLTLVEKKWLAFQLVCAVNEFHSLNIVHGDMKTENVLVNSFLWLSLADLASYKPVYLSKNHPSADFNYYFDISRRRTCCLAPERLGHLTTTTNTTTTTTTTQRGGGIRPGDGHETSASSSSSSAMYNEMKPPDPNDFQPSMDIFSLGCVIAELFMERPVFDFARLLAYRERKYDPVAELSAEIAPQCRHILDMVLNMLSLHSGERASAAAHLQEQSDKAFPGYFVVLKNYVSRFIGVGLMPDDIVVKLKADLPLLLRSFSSSVYSAETLPPSPSTNE